MNASLESLFSLEGRRALVTGASRGLGRGMAEALASAGADVVCASSKPGGAAETAEAVRAMGRTAWEVDADLADRDAVLAMAERAERLAGGIDVLVNNGGTIRRHPAVDHPLADWDAVLRTNLDAVFLLSQRLGRGMIERGAGKIVNVASLLSFSGGITVPGYTASKHAVAGVTKALANEWARFGVQVNAIAPGYFATDNTERLRADETRFAEISARIPAARWGDPQDLAGAVIFLASRASDYVNGHVLVVDGGWMAR
ncbi:2-deoxy-D-gluconate 3-dehydrogenase [Gemmatirosa kalamazoonensis]|uniref:2-deoxy-D-gluconate 3-dehydrogenase n=1 Tax=Gemmatirosa kalamazoonensis TaxID=861299 RepID=W0RBS4_9BACT|nr:2-dehydro-3-deoxy-D-gluconate 5-dehydrogenase KduD [Gemmatirosa kalamazoonensis]AHG87907.1 2-deoxy-D-gluconate 3-dehydrogenase [Gemmatirosa kalamazoonensis]